MPTDEISKSPLTLTKPIIATTKSNKRKVMLAIDGYHFQLKNVNGKKTTKFWRCANRACGVIVHTTTDDEFIRFSGGMAVHCHMPNPAETEIRDLRESMRKRAQTDLIPLQEIAEDEIRQRLLTGEALAVLPNITNIGMLCIYFNYISTPVRFSSQSS